MRRAASGDDTKRIRLVTPRNRVNELFSVIIHQGMGNGTASRRLEVRTDLRHIGVGP